MIVVTVHLVSANDGSVTPLAVMEIANDGTGSRTRGNCNARTLRGRSSRAFADRVTQRETTLKDWPRERLHVWNLVATLLARMGYGMTDVGQDAR